MRKLLTPLLLCLILAQSASAQYTYYFPIIFKSPQIVKRGIVSYPLNDTSCNDIELTGADWYYNYWHITAGCGADRRFVPMLNRPGLFDSRQAIDELVASGQTGGYILGYNEPDYAIWGEVTPRDGAIIWRQLEAETAGTGIKLVSPAPSQYDPEWLLRMMVEYHNLYDGLPQFDAIALHYYGTAENTKRYISDWREFYAHYYPGVKVWLTEFNSCLLDKQDTAQYFAELLPWLDSQSWIERYAYFITQKAPGFPETYNSCVLLDDAGLTATGAMYVQ